MRRRNREINIFNLSMLDVIAGAMAAFLIIMVVLMPYYRKEHIDYQAMIAELRQQLAAAEARASAAEAAARDAQAAAAQAQARIAAAEAAAEAARQAARAAQERAQRAESRAAALERELARTFLVLFVRWDTRDDVDLHVVDPSGAEFYWQRKTIAGRPGELSEDNTNGPGNEVWEIRDAPVGLYRVYVNLFALKDSRQPVVQGRVFHRDGSAAFRATRLTRRGEKLLLATIRVDGAGDVTIE